MPSEGQSLTIDEQRNSAPSEKRSSLAPLKYASVAPASSRKRRNSRRSSSNATSKSRTHVLQPGAVADGLGFGFDSSFDKLAPHSSSFDRSFSNGHSQHVNLDVPLSPKQLAQYDLESLEHLPNDVRRRPERSLSSSSNASAVSAVSSSHVPTPSGANAGSAGPSPAFFAKFLLDSGRAMNARYNVMDSMNEKDPVKSEQSPNLRIQISHGSMNRARTVQAILALKYVSLGRSQRVPDGELIKYPGVEGVYNPLQVIRNREVRAKYHEYPPPLSYANLPLPCNAFSSHNAPGMRPWKMVWAVDLNEMVNDIPWRKAHWHELRHPNGGFWFPLKVLHQSSSASSSSEIALNHDSRKLDHGRLHDKLWAASDAGGPAEYNEPHANLSAAAPVGSRSSIGFRKHLKEKAKKIYHSNSDHDSSSNDNFKSSESLMRSKRPFAHHYRNHSRGRQSQSDFDDLVNLLPSYSQLQKDSKSSSKDETANININMNNNNRAGPPIITINDALENSNEKDQSASAHIEDTSAQAPPADATSKGRLGDVSFTPLHLRRNSEQSSVRSLSLEDQPEQQGQQSPPKTPKTPKMPMTPVALAKSTPLEQQREPRIEDLRLASVCTGQVYLDQLVRVNENFLTNFFPQLAESSSNHMDSIMEKEISLLLHSILQINDFQIPSYERFFGGFLDECKSVMHVINDNYVVRIDNLLSATDRSIGELNTSLALDLRKVNEQLDRLNLSLFGNIVTEALNERRNAVNISDGEDYKMLYYFLENAIVVLLRLAWVVVNIYKLFAGIVKLLWRVVTLFFGL